MQSRRYRDGLVWKRSRDAVIVGIKKRDGYSCDVQLILSFHHSCRTSLCNIGAWYCPVRPQFYIVSNNGIFTYLTTICSRSEPTNHPSSLKWYFIQCWKITQFLPMFVFPRHLGRDSTISMECHCVLGWFPLRDVEGVARYYISNIYWLSNSSILFLISNSSIWTFPPLEITIGSAHLWCILYCSSNFSGLFYWLLSIVPQPSHNAQVVVGVVV